MHRCVPDEHYTDAMTRPARPRSHDPLRLDVAALAAEGAELAGQWPLAELTRLRESTATHDGPDEPVHWSARGEVISAVGRPDQLWLHLGAHGIAWLSCQRCLQPLAEPLQVQTSIRFMRDEAEAERLDAEVEYDVLALPRALDLRELIEDELLLALPLVPRHDRCPQPLAARAGEALPQEPFDGPEAPHPFATLSALKNPPKG